MNRVDYRSQSDCWETPQWLFDLLCSEFAPELDVCTTKENGNAKNSTPEIDGLTKTWEGVCWINSSIRERYFAVDREGVFEFRSSEPLLLA